MAQLTKDENQEIRKYLKFLSVTVKNDDAENVSNLETVVSSDIRHIFSGSNPKVILPNSLGRLQGCIENCVLIHKFRDGDTTPEINVLLETVSNLELDAYNCPKILRNAFKEASEKVIKATRNPTQNLKFK